jgi:hypothetical protein
MAETRVVQGYVDPNFPNPMTESSATIIIYGFVSTSSMLKRTRKLTSPLDTHLPSPLES